MPFSAQPAPPVAPVEFLSDPAVAGRSSKEPANGEPTIGERKAPTADTANAAARVCEGPEDTDALLSNVMREREKERESACVRERHGVRC